MRAGDSRSERAVNHGATKDADRMRCETEVEIGHPTMTPQLQQAIRMLKLSNLELTGFLEGRDPAAS